MKAYMLAAHAAIALTHCDESMEAISAACACLSCAVAAQYPAGATNHLRTISSGLEGLNQLARALRATTQALDLSTNIGDQQQLFLSRLWCMRVHSLLGHWARAEELWELLDSMGRGWSRDQYRPGMAEYAFALFQFWRGTLQEEHLATAERLSTEGKSPVTVRKIHWLRGMWLLEKGNWEGAAASCREALRLARAAGVTVGSCETGLAWAKFHLGQLVEPRREVERLARLRRAESCHLAQLWLALGEIELAKDCALTAYTRAWADGEPYVRRYQLVQATELLHQLGIPLPKLARYDEAKNERLPWEADVDIAIETLRGQLQATPS
jgi:tetratricopeptide (TPR) repeat protein